MREENWLALGVASASETIASLGQHQRDALDYQISTLTRLRSEDEKPDMSATHR